MKWKLSRFVTPAVADCLVDGESARSKAIIEKREVDEGGPHVIDGFRTNSSTILPFFFREVETTGTLLFWPC
jgi:hypothetical protein